MGSMLASDSTSRLTCTRALVCNERDQACGRSSKSELHAALPEQQQDEYCRDCRYSSAFLCKLLLSSRNVFRNHKFIQLVELSKLQLCVWDCALRACIPCKCAQSDSNRACTQARTTNRLSQCPL
jgi:hypothetical protein